MLAFVYFNLHRKVWSVKALEGEYKGLVVAHAETVTLKDATPKVSAVGRQRVLESQEKNVHAGIVGEVVEVGEATYRYNTDLVNPKEKFKRKLAMSSVEEVTYNPYLYETFVFSKTGGVWTGADEVFFSAKNRKVFAMNSGV